MRKGRVSGFAALVKVEQIRTLCVLFCLCADSLYCGRRERDGRTHHLDDCVSISRLILEEYNEREV